MRRASEKHDEEFFVVKNNGFYDDEMRPRPPVDGPPMDGEFQQVDKKALQERRVTRLVTRASFVSFLMWLFIFVAAAIGLKAAKQQSDSRWFMRCSFRKSIIFLALASGLGIWKLVLDHKIMKQMERFSKELEQPGSFGKSHGKNGMGGKKGCGKNKNKKNKFEGKNKEDQFYFNDFKQMSKLEQNQRIQEMFD